MTKFVLFSDLHAHAFPEFGANERLLDCLTVLGDVRAYCVKHKITKVFFGGDLFHKRGVVYTTPYVAVANELLLFKSAGIAFYAVDGNHDHEDKDGKTHALQPLMAGGLMHGIGPAGYRVVELDRCCLTMFAYCESKDVLAERIKASRRSIMGSMCNASQIALFHHGFKGARVGSTLEYEVKEPIDAKALKLNKLYTMVFSGHYHAHQRIEGVKNGWYIGSPLEHTRSDRSEERKGFLVVDTDTMTFKRVALDRPRFVSLNVDDDVADVKGNFIDVTYAKADASLDAFLALVKERGARGVNPIPLPSAKQQHKKRLNVSPTLSPGKVVKRYIKHRRRDIKRQGLDQVALMRLGLELVRRAEQE